MNHPRASQIFDLEYGLVTSSIADRVWRTRSEPLDMFTSVATVHWKMVVTRFRGTTTFTVRGPETKATAVPIPQDAEFFGIDFLLGTLMPGLSAGLVDRAISLPAATTRSVWLNGSAWEIPTFDNADVFLKRLVRRGIVVRDSTVDAILRGETAELTPRSIRRRVRHATGLTLGTIRQIERAHQAVGLIESGNSILDAVAQYDYADQPHLTRSLRRFVGHTPAQIARQRSVRTDCGPMRRRS